MGLLERMPRSWLLGSEAALEISEPTPPLEGLKFKAAQVMWCVAMHAVHLRFCVAYLVVASSQELDLT